MNSYRVAQLGTEKVWQVQQWRTLPRTFWQWLRGDQQDMGWMVKSEYHAGYDGGYHVKQEFDSFYKACVAMDKFIEKERIEEERTKRFTADLWEARKSC